MRKDDCMKKVLITGGNGGIGKCLCEGFAKAGYEVFSLDLASGEFGDPCIHCYQVDLRDEREVQECFLSIQQQYGVLDVLINNGGISQFQKSIQEITIDEFDDVIKTNLRGAFLCAKAYIAQSSVRTYGRIINIASTRFHQNEPHWEAYGASKGGIVSFTNSLCVSLSNTHITVNTITPGWIETKQYDSLTKEDHEQHPCGRVGKPQDILQLCLFLCEEENDFIDGANIVVDGGMSKRMIYNE